MLVICCSNCNRKRYLLKPGISLMTEVYLIILMMILLSLVNNLEKSFVVE